jgi:hypothetical protein
MSRRRLAVAAAASFGLSLAMAASAWACVSGPVVNLSTVNVKAGEQVGVTGTGFRNPDPVQVRFNALDGPVIATLAKPVDRNIRGTVTIPPGTPPGNYVLIFSQVDERGTITQAPIRSLVTVVGSTGQTPVLGADPTQDGVVRQAGLVRTDNSVSSGTLALIALGVAGVGMFAAGIAALLGSRRAEQARPVPVR